MELKKKFTSKFDNFDKKYSVNAERSKNSIIKQPNIFSNIDIKLTLVTEKINAGSEKKSFKCHNF